MGPDQGWKDAGFGSTSTRPITLPNITKDAQYLKGNRAAWRLVSRSHRAGPLDKEHMKGSAPRPRGWGTARIQPERPHAPRCLYSTLASCPARGAQLLVEVRVCPNRKVAPEGS